MTLDDARGVGPHVCGGRGSERGGTMSGIEVGGAHPGEVVWLDDHVALVWCDGHDEPMAVYEAACHEGADLDDVDAVPARDASGPGCWYVGPKECLLAMPSSKVWLDD